MQIFQINKIELNGAWMLAKFYNNILSPPFITVLTGSPEDYKYLIY